MDLHPRRFHRPDAGEIRLHWKLRVARLTLSIRGRLVIWVTSRSWSNGSARFDAVFPTNVDPSLVPEDMSCINTSSSESEKLSEESESTITSDFFGEIVVIVSGRSSSSKSGRWWTAFVSSSGSCRSLISRSKLRGCLRFREAFGVGSSFKRPPFGILKLCCTFDRLWRSSKSSRVLSIRTCGFGFVGISSTMAVVADWEEPGYDSFPAALDCFGGSSSPSRQLREIRSDRCAPLSHSPEMSTLVFVFAGMITSRETKWGYAVVRLLIQQTRISHLVVASTDGPLVQTLKLSLRVYLSLEL